MLLFSSYNLNRFKYLPRPVLFMEIKLGPFKFKAEYLKSRPVEGQLRKRIVFPSPTINLVSIKQSNASQVAEEIRGYMEGSTDVLEEFNRFSESDDFRFMGTRVLKGIRYDEGLNSILLDFHGPQSDSDPGLVLKLDCAPTVAQVYNYRGTKKGLHFSLSTNPRNNLIDRMEKFYLFQD